MTAPKFTPVSEGQLNESGWRADASDTRFTNQTLEEIEATTYKKIYQDLKSSMLIPLDVSVDAGAESTAFEMLDQVGRAKLMDDFAEDVPVADAFVTKTVVPIRGMKLKWVWNVMEMERARKAGKPLASDRAEAVRDGIEFELDRIAALGDADAGLTGFFNNANVSLTNVTNGGWGAGSFENVLADMHQIGNAIPIAAGSVMPLMPDTIVLDQASYYEIITKNNGNTDNSVLKVFLEQSPHINTVEVWPLADTAGTANAPRAVVYRKDPRVLQKVVPQPFKFLERHYRGAGVFEQTGIARTAGVKVRYPVAMQYFENM